MNNINGTKVNGKNINGSRIQSNGSRGKAREIGRLERIGLDVIAFGFPELLAVPIRMRWAHLEGSWFEYTPIDNRGWEYLFEADKSLKREDDFVLEGGIAHELAHTLNFHSMDDKAREIDYYLYRKSDEYFIWDERRTDKLVIQRGYGPQLLAFTRCVGRRGSLPTRKQGLTLKEIRRALRGRTVSSWI